MRLSDRHREIISKMEADGYVWLSHMPVNAQMRFRNRTKNGFKGYIKVEGLTFLTMRVAEAIKLGSRTKSQPRVPLGKQLEEMEKRLVELEAENYILKGVGAKKEQLRFSADE